MENDYLNKYDEEGELKLKINEFLFVTMPDHTTIKQLDQLASIMHEQITAVKLNEGKNNA